MYILGKEGRGKQRNEGVGKLIDKIKMGGKAIILSRVFCFQFWPFLFIFEADIDFCQILWDVELFKLHL